MSQEAISAPCPSIFDGLISSRRTLTQKGHCLLHTCLCTKVCYRSWKSENCSNTL